MPTRFKSKSVSRKRFRRRYNRPRSIRSVAIQRSVAPIADVQVLKLRYCSYNHQVTTGVAPVSILFRGNSIFDPQFAVGGHQPLGFDQWSTFYDKYVVTGSTMYAIVANASNTDNIKAALIPKDESTVVTTWNTIAERSYSMTKVLSPNDSGKSVGHFRKYMSTKKILGLKHVNTQDDDYTAAVSADPAKEWFWHVYVQALNDVSAISVNVQFVVTYYVKFFNRKPLLAS